MSADHTCFDEMNEKLKPHNAKIAHGFGFTQKPNGLRLAYFVQTEKLDSNIRSKKPPLVVMTHCPFCGTSLEEVSA